MCLGQVFTPELAALVLQTPVVATTLFLQNGSCAELTPTLFQKVVLHFSLTLLHVYRCHLRSSHITDGFLEALSKSVRRTKVWDMVPVDGDRFDVTDDALVERCLQEDAHADEEDMEKVEFLCKGSFTKDLFKRLVEVSTDPSLFLTR